MDLTEIIKATKNIKKQIRSLLPDISKEIDLIIESNDQSSPRIEKLLDTLLNFGQMGLGKADFIRLNSYYATFNQEYAHEYSTIYQEMNEQE